MHIHSIAFRAWCLQLTIKIFQCCTRVTLTAPLVTLCCMPPHTCFQLAEALPACCLSVWFSAVQDMSSGDEGQDDFFAVPHNIEAAVVDAGAPAAAVAEGASGPLASAEVGSAVGVVPEWFRQWRPKARKAAAMARAIEFAAARDVEPAASKPARGKGAAGAAGGAKAGTSKGKKRQRPAPAAGVAEPGSP